MGNNAPILEVRTFSKLLAPLLLPRISMLTFQKVRLLVSLVQMVRENLFC